MDTKWKKNKRGIGAVTFFLGITLLLGDILQVTGMIAGGITAADIRDSMQSDYQKTSSFRFYMEGYLEDFLSMASGGEVGFSWNNNSRTRGISYSSYYGQESYGYAGDGNVMVFGIQSDARNAASSVVTVTTDAETAADEVSTEQSAWEGTVTEGSSDQAGQEGGDASQQSYPESEASGSVDIAESTQSPKEDNGQAADEAHEMLKGCKNLLYTINYKENELYSNVDGMLLDGENRILPEGYNFLLYFDGSRVYMQKDGKEIDIYGDGQYTDNGSWFVPGYENFPVDEKYKDARITIAAARDPLPYTVAVYGGGYTYYTGGNRLYQIVRDMQDTKASLYRVFWLLMASLFFLIVGTLFRKERREAGRRLALITGKLWYEAKVLAVLVPAGFLLYYLMPAFRNLYYAGVHPDIYYQYTIYQLRPLILAVFWLVWLAVNDAGKNSQVWKNSLFVRICRSLSVKELEYPFQKRMVRRFRKLPVVTGGLSVLLAAVMILWTKETAFGAFSGVIMWSLTILAVLGAAAAQAVYVRSLRRDTRDIGDLIDQIYAVREGDMEAPLKLPADSDLHDAVTCMNEIREGMKEAIDEQVRSERMKVELIANVSHDIKTPLTSIISYVELLKEEEELPEHVKDYVSILESKSQRLKTMVQDVFEVSKAASGELPVKLETIDFAKLLRQTLADMEEVIKDANVTVRPQIPEEERFIRADGQRMYRVFQNLIQNALQYSLDGSRVYISLEEKEGLLTASVTNTSAVELSGDIDYTARFTRGDSSRTDGGSGLGLSIARSFTEACQGNFRIEIRADLFTAYVEFRETQEQEMEVP